MTRSTLAGASQKRSSGLFKYLAQRLIELTITLHIKLGVGLALKRPLYEMNSTTIDKCSKLVTWANFGLTKPAVKAHNMIDLRGGITLTRGFSETNVRQFTGHRSFGKQCLQVSQIPL